jgi:PTS system nitrogen regulatory IIA component
MNEEILTPNEVAARLKVAVVDVVRAAERGELPGFRVAGQWRFSSGQLERWAARPGAPPLPGPPPPPREDDQLSKGLGELLPPDNILAELQARNGPGVIYEVAAFAAQRGLVTSETWFAGALAEREAMMSTAVEGGMAFLHARQTATDFVVRPFVVLARTPHGVPFGAPDGGPTTLFFTLGLKYDRLHLRWLSRLARLLRSPSIVAALNGAPDAPAIQAILLGRDRTIE